MRHSGRDSGFEEGAVGGGWEQVAEYYVANRIRLLAFVESKVDDDSLAEDILQDSLLKALRSVPELKDSEKLVPWSYRILRNAIADTYRRRAVSARRLLNSGGLS